MAHKLRHGLSERPEYPLDGLIEIDESYYPAFPGWNGIFERPGRDSDIRFSVIDNV
jgi:hypothetical protein